MLVSPQPVVLATPAAGRRRRVFASLCRLGGDDLGYRVAQRVLDIAVSLVVLLVTAPLIAALAILVRATSPGPALFRHRRTQIDRRRSDHESPTGCDRRRDDLGGQQFILYKFRTMYADAPRRFPELYSYDYSPAELAGLPIKVLVGLRQHPDAWHVGDPRITPIGRWLRRTSLDELPNFINVLKGDMHLVGPRPDITENIRHYPPAHRLKLRVKPGVTGLAQINGRGRLSLLRTNEYDLEYVRNRSLRLDLTIIVKTVAATLRRDGAC